MSRFSTKVENRLNSAARNIAMLDTGAICDAERERVQAVLDGLAGLIALVRQPLPGAALTPRRAAAAAKPAQDDDDDNPPAAATDADIAQALATPVGQRTAWQEAILEDADPGTF